MTNEIKTRRLIVTLPDTSGEEADTIASSIESAVQEGIFGDVDTWNATVTHALGETLPIGMTAKLEADRIYVRDGGQPLVAILNLNVGEARQLAGALLRLADEAEANGA